MAAKMTKFYDLFLIILIVIFTRSVVATEEFTILTHDYPPYQYQQGNQLKGISTAIVKAILQRLDYPDNIQVRSWNAGYYLTQIRTKHILFSMTRIPERENLFKWVGPITSFTYYFFKKKGSPIHLTSLEDAKHVNSIGTIKNYDTHLFLASNGFNNLKLISNDVNNYKAFSVNRLDLIPLGQLAIPFVAKQAQVKPTIFENTGVKLFEAHYYIAFSKDTADETITQWQQALDEIKASGLYHQIYTQAVQEAYADFQVYDEKPTIVFFNSTPVGNSAWEHGEAFMQAIADNLELNLEIYHANEDKYALMNQIRNVLQAPTKPEAILFQQHDYYDETILQLTNKFKIPAFMLSTHESQIYGTPRQQYPYWLGEMSLAKESLATTEIFLQGGWALILLHDYLQGFDFAEEGLSFSSYNQPSIHQVTPQQLKVFQADNWRKIDFKQFSKRYNPELKYYNFSLARLIQQHQDASTAESTANVIHLITSEWAPYTSIKMKNYGVFTAIVTAAFQEMGITPEYIFEDWLKGYDKLLDGSQLATFPYTRTPKREQEVYFSPAIISSKYVLFYNKLYKTDFNYNNWSDLKKYSIAGVPGYFYEETFKQQGIKYYKFNSEALALRELYQGHIDLFPTDELVGLTLLQELYPNNYKQVFSQLPKPLLTSAFHVIFSKTHPDGEKMRDLFAEGLARIKAKGIYQTILDHGLQQH